MNKKKNTILNFWCQITFIFDKLQLYGVIAAKFSLVCEK